MSRLAYTKTRNTETKPPEPPEPPELPKLPEQPKRNHRNNRNTRKTRRREPQKVPKVIKQTVSITETYASSTNNGRSTGMDNLGPQRLPEYVSVISLTHKKIEIFMTIVLD